MDAMLEAYPGSSVSFEFEELGEAVFDKRCPICAKFMKWPKGELSIIIKGGEFNTTEPLPICKVHGLVKPCFEGWF